ncbi:MAG TPA: SPOR domain-containing protein [Stellaceae bacterium]|jgi:cell division septation protein DedD|nr:SPOR domain-containing protein [Stellaceae bacterium]
MTSRLEIEPEDRRREEAAPAPRNRGMLRAALLMIAVAGLAGGSWWAGHGNKSAAPETSAVPEIHADAGPVKEAPADPGGMVVPDQDSALLNHDAKAKPEELLPPPEAVKPRPVAAAPPPTAAPALPPAATAPQQAPLQQAPPAQVAVVPALPPPVATPAPAAKAAPPQPSAAGSGYRLQLGALKTEDAAKAEWQKLQKQHTDVLGKLSLTVSRVDLGAKGVYYRIQAGPIADAGQAAQDCAALKSRNVGCILVKP